MKLLNIVSFLSVLMITIVSSAHTLNVSITNLRSRAGNVLVSVYNKAEGFPKHPETAYIKMKMTTGESAKFVIPNLPTGTYALAVAHDENSNDEIDTGFLGIPKEGVGFSRNPSITFGPPKFDEAAYTISADGQIEIKMHYY
jgi:uncharacterized protein (DUF2141 family)